MKIRARLGLWSEVLSHMISAPLASILEVGANLGIKCVRSAFVVVSTPFRCGAEREGAQSPNAGENRLFKRDFGGLWLDTCPDLRVVAYGFAWKRLTGLDNLTWWLFEKR